MGVDHLAGGIDSTVSLWHLDAVTDEEVQHVREGARRKLGRAMRMRLRRGLEHLAGRRWRVEVQLDLDGFPLVADEFRPESQQKTRFE